ncbi:exopolysaccharide biosynthesis polyprenyl glycosylphosphotransferase [Chryseobacterium carnipullorum]|uniref:Colanic biosynthesis UDP-glucose lipid carrier transferase n=1 Tax=Chryseobacterium carnipullorum TaxID=1124835 RepID=A0A1M7AAL0_CHRCU|nr:exopolysaccharide biosynthesis polyprenyl glycosylphosphotransferase [Chryseobacterium carnipullorum]AZA48088.1 exopolysaccharide biosynthesis polyprenyl glycosylphosphotransferase [Chryseobacterium carnipullorum]AZA67401.1 exopolysaccharide biosynthesis polyprenyl glycosylphosphotransferase [Chryseobacterium carnipullorum]SHL39834.1 putative colanic acid biosysnthesis UDP-glucose lipid carrier transferase [Chryseobacterium carnipullorum]STD13885.1 Putative colanic biosynthesis UDP-glucose l
MQRIRYSRYLKSIIILLDLMVIASIFIFFFISRNESLRYHEETWYQNVFSLILLFMFWMLLSGRTKIYNIQRNLTYTLFLERLLIHFLFFILGVLLIGKVSKNVFFNSDIYWLSFYLFFFIFLAKSVIYFAIKYFRSLGVNYRNVMFLGETGSTEILKNIFKERKDYGYKTFDYEKSDISPNELVSFWKKNGIHTLFLSTENNFSDSIEQEIFKLAEDNKVHVSLIPSITQSDFFLYDLGYIQTQPILSQAKYPLDYYSNFLVKRVFDIAFSVIILVLLCSWLFPIIAAVIKATSKGPVFFVQKRYGFHEEVFSCLKFRTMVVNEESSTKTTEENDSRITKIGKFLRKTSLDELPQFINVLKGEMSIVGPRPHMLAVDNYYKPKIGRYSLRSMVSPGITGLAQVSGLRGDYGDVEVEMKKRILADTFYVRNWSFVLDLVIILKTVLLVIGGDKNAK